MTLKKPHKQKQDTSAPVRRLSRSEMESLRLKKKEADDWMRAELEKRKGQ
jgi:hypothetical protein